jgi:hypothetical protein
METRTGSQAGGLVAGGAFLLLALFALFLAAGSVTALQDDVTAYCLPTVKCDRGQIQAGYVASLVGGTVALGMFSVAGGRALLMGMRGRAMPTWVVILGCSALIPLGTAFGAALWVETLDGIAA